MSDPALRIDRLGKKYRIGAPAEDRKRGGSPFGYLLSTLRGPSEAEILWALKDISFEVEEGEVVGVIGRNGAGKSTLLKILSRITHPTEGRAEIFGRVASLLEVGTGFHNELTGRENIYLNGAFLGMSRQEVARRFDEIVAFSGVERFIDTPVKRYSSGMYVRLAFSVAAHLEPEILLVDEVLSVGDMEFQKKCLDRMHRVTSEGRTILFVSHNLAAVKSLCGRGVLLNEGRCIREGPVDEVVDAYVRTVLEAGPAGAIPPGAPRIGTAEALCRKVLILDRAGRAAQNLYFGQPFRVVLTLEATKTIPDAVFEIGISAPEGTRIATSFTVDHERSPLVLEKGWRKIALDLEADLLPGHYTLDVGSHHSGGLTIDMVQRVLDFTVMNVSETGGDCHLPARTRGFVRPKGRWSAIEPAESTTTAPSAA